MSRRIGLTGGIGSGKSTVASLLQQQGAWLVDTDAIAHRLTAPGGSALTLIAAHFGPEMLAADGGLDRARMRQAAFADPAARRELEAILHPMIGEQARAEAALASPGQAVVFDIPLLAESGHWRARVDRVLVVDCSAERQIERVTRRSGWSAGQVRQVIALQATRAQRRAVADAVLVNETCSIDGLGRMLHQLWQDGFMAPVTSARS